MPKIYILYIGKRCLLVLFALHIIIACKEKKTDQLQVEFLYPKNNYNSIKGKVIDFKINTLEDGSLIKNVEIYIDNKLISTINNIPYEYFWNTENEKIGNHIINAKVKDNIGNSKECSITVCLSMTAPVVKTLPMKYIGETFVIAQMEITSLGVPTANFCGVCWDTTPNPTPNNNYVRTDTLLQTHLPLLNNLQINKKYYLRAFAQNNDSTIYGEEITFSTNSNEVKNNYFMSSEFEIIGESMALRGEAISYLTRIDARIDKVYKLSENGITIYQSGIDFIELPEGAIKRTKNSTIPDYSFHKIILNKNGKFSFTPDPNRNPELNIPWQIMVDYKTNLDALVDAKGNEFSKKLKQKFEAKEDIFIQSIGTSITAGAHTLPNYFENSDKATYVQLIANAINKLYGNIVTVENLAIGGSTSNSLFIPKLDYLLTQKHLPDVLFIEFGMNEHFDLSNMNEALNEIETDIKKLSSKGINCVLVGFFQQNPDWEIENEQYTLYFNYILKDIAARNNIYFADIHSQFKKISNEKIFRDIMADCIHHPTDFGHKLYYLSTIPFALFDNKNESELLKLIQ